jgi:hypothetical protein
VRKVNYLKDNIDDAAANDTNEVLFYTDVGRFYFKFFIKKSYIFLRKCILTEDPIVSRIAMIFGSGYELGNE